MAKTLRIERCEECPYCEVTRGAITGTIRDRACQWGGGWMLIGKDEEIADFCSLPDAVDDSHLSRAQQIIAGWPKWKQELADQILRPSPEPKAAPRPAEEDTQ